MVLNNYYTEEQKEKIRVVNRKFADDLKLAIFNKKIGEFFDSFGFKPRFLDIVETLFCFPDGEKMILDLYDYIIKDIKDIHIPAFVQKLESHTCFHFLLISDFEVFFERSLNSNSILTNNIVDFADAMIKIPGGDILIMSKLDKILNGINPMFICNIVKLFENKAGFDKLVSDNFEKWIIISRGDSTIYLIDLILKIDQYYAIKYIKKNFDHILNNVGNGKMFNVLSIFSNYIELISLMKDKIESIISYGNAFDIRNILTGLDEKLNLGIAKNNDILFLLREKLSIEKQRHLAIGAIIKSRKNEYLKSLIYNLMKQENVDDFMNIGDDSWSNIVFKIGKRVLKLGWIRNNPDCDSHYRIIEPEKYEIIYDKNGNPILYIEIQQCLSQEGISESDIQDFYDDIDEDEYIYIDPRGLNPTNFGILNNIDFKNYVGQKVSESFKKKAVVLVDRDCFWRKNNPNIKYMSKYY
jgi:hypothetical protein